MEELFLRVVGTNPIMQALAGGLVISFLNLIGAVSIYLMRNPT